MTGADPHAGAAVLHKGPPIEAASAVLICLHGRGGTARDALSLGAAVAPPGTALIAPEAKGNTWYPRGFLAPIAENQPYVDSALGLLRGIVDGLRRAGVSRARTMVMGFSQGACLACEFIGRRPDAASRAAVLTGGLIGRELDEAQYPEAGEAAAVFLSTGVPDQHVPEDRVIASARLLERRRHVVTVATYAGRPHTVSRDEVERVTELLR